MFDPDNIIQTEFSITVVNTDGYVIARKTGKESLGLEYESDFSDGDRIVLETTNPGQFIHLKLDEEMPEVLVYLRESKYEFVIPVGQDKVSYSPRSFSQKPHYIHVRNAHPEDVSQRRNLALNPFDQHGNHSIFPHAKANVETRGEAVFAARNAIDGEYANDDHGYWPYTSWGINQDPDAALLIDFGRPVIVDSAVISLRADFPHDAWWERAILTCSGGQEWELNLSKTGNAQVFPLGPRKVEWVRLHSLVKADDPSPFPALTQVQIWGNEV